MPIEIFVLSVFGFVLLFAMAVRGFVDNSEGRKEMKELREHLDGLSAPRIRTECSPLEKTILFGDTFDEVVNMIRSKMSPEFKISHGITLQKKTGKYTAVLERVMQWDKEEERFI